MNIITSPEQLERVALAAAQSSVAASFSVSGITRNDPTEAASAAVAAVVAAAANAAAAAAVTSSAGVSGDLNQTVAAPTSVVSSSTPSETRSPAHSHSQAMLEGSATVSSHDSDSNTQRPAVSTVDRSLAPSPQVKVNAASYPLTPSSKRDPGSVADKEAEQPASMGKVPTNADRSQGAKHEAKGEKQPRSSPTQIHSQKLLSDVQARMMTLSPRDREYLGMKRARKTIQQYLLDEAGSQEISLRRRIFVSTRTFFVCVLFVIAALLTGENVLAWVREVANAPWLILYAIITFTFIVFSSPFSHHTEEGPPSYFSLSSIYTAWLFAATAYHLPLPWLHSVDLQLSIPLFITVSAGTFAFLLLYHLIYMTLAWWAHFASPSFVKRSFVPRRHISHGVSIEEIWGLFKNSLMIALACCLVYAHCGDGGGSWKGSWQPQVDVSLGTPDQGTLLSPLPIGTGRISIDQSHDSAHIVAENTNSLDTSHPSESSLWSFTPVFRLIEDAKLAFDKILHRNAKEEHPSAANATAPGSHYSAPARSSAPKPPKHAMMALRTQICAAWLAPQPAQRFHSFYKRLAFFVTPQDFVGDATDASLGNTTMNVKKSYRAAKLRFLRDITSFDRGIWAKLKYLDRSLGKLREAVDNSPAINTQMIYRAVQRLTRSHNSHAKSDELTQSFWATFLKLIRQSSWLRQLAAQMKNDLPVVVNDPGGRQPDVHETPTAGETLRVLASLFRDEGSVEALTKTFIVLTEELRTANPSQAVVQEVAGEDLSLVHALQAGLARVLGALQLNATIDSLTETLFGGVLIQGSDSLSNRIALLSNLTDPLPDQTHLLEELDDASNDEFLTVDVEDENDLYISPVWTLWMTLVSIYMINYFFERSQSWTAALHESGLALPEQLDELATATQSLSCCDQHPGSVETAMDETREVSKQGDVALFADDGASAESSHHQLAQSSEEVEVLANLASGIAPVDAAALRVLTPAPTKTVSRVKPATPATKPTSEESVNLEVLRTPAQAQLARSPRQLSLMRSASAITQREHAKRSIPSTTGAAPALAHRLGLHLADPTAHKSPEVEKLLRVARAAAVTEALASGRAVPMYLSHSPGVAGRNLSTTKAWVPQDMPPLSLASGVTPSQPDEPPPPPSKEQSSLNLTSPFAGLEDSNVKSSKASKTATAATECGDEGYIADVDDNESHHDEDELESVPHKEKSPVSQTPFVRAKHAMSQVRQKIGTALRSSLQQIAGIAGFDNVKHAEESQGEKASLTDGELPESRTSVPGAARRTHSLSRSPAGDISDSNLEVSRSGRFNFLRRISNSLRRYMPFVHPQVRRQPQSSIAPTILRRRYFNSALARNEIPAVLNMLEPSSGALPFSQRQSNECAVHGSLSHPEDGVAFQPGDQHTLSQAPGLQPTGDHTFILSSAKHAPQSSANVALRNSMLAETRSEGNASQSPHIRPGRILATNESPELLPLDYGVTTSPGIMRQSSLRLRDISDSPSISTRSARRGSRAHAYLPTGPSPRPQPLPLMPQPPLASHGDALPAPLLERRHSLGSPALTLASLESSSANQPAHSAVGGRMGLATADATALGTTPAVSRSIAAKLYALQRGLVQQSHTLRSLQEGRPLSLQRSQSSIPVSVPITPASSQAKVGHLQRFWQSASRLGENLLDAVTQASRQFPGHFNEDAAFVPGTPSRDEKVPAVEGPTDDALKTQQGTNRADDKLSSVGVLTHTRSETIKGESLYSAVPDPMGAHEAGVPQQQAPPQAPSPLGHPFGSKERLYYRYDHIESNPRFLPMVSWFSITSWDIWHSVFDIIVSFKLFSGRFDRRILEAAEFAPVPPPSLSNEAAGSPFSMLSMHLYEQQRMYLRQLHAYFQYQIQQQQLQMNKIISDLQHNYIENMRALACGELQSITPPPMQVPQIQTPDFHLPPPPPLFIDPAASVKDPSEGDGTMFNFETADELWFDWMADTGDGGNSTYSVARMLAQPMLDVVVTPERRRALGIPASFFENSPQPEQFIRAQEKVRKKRGEAQGHSGPGSSMAPHNPGVVERMKGWALSVAAWIGDVVKCRSSAKVTEALPQMTEDIDLSDEEEFDAGVDKDVKLNLRLPRAKLLVIGGDLAYPNPSTESYKDRFILPFEYAMAPPEGYDGEAIAVNKPDLPYGTSKLEDYEGPVALVMPGNHDWFDGLDTYAKFIPGRHWLGGWLLPQTRSYFAAKLVHGWWLFAIDLALIGDIDMHQFKYFATIAETHLRLTDRVIVCTHEPTWALAWYEGSLEPRNLLHLLTVHLRGRCMLRLAGDIHNYIRHSHRDAETEQIAIKRRREHERQRRNHLRALEKAREHLASKASKVSKPQPYESGSEPQQPRRMSEAINHTGILTQPPKGLTASHTELDKMSFGYEDPAKLHNADSDGPQEIRIASAPTSAEVTDSDEEVEEDDHLTSDSNDSNREALAAIEEEAEAIAAQDEEEDAVSQLSSSFPFPAHLVISGGGGAFLHPTHPFSFPLQHEGGQIYHPIASYPNVVTSRRITFKNILGFRKKNWRFDVLGGFMYFMVIFSLVPLCGVSEYFLQGPLSILPELFATVATGEMTPATAVSSAGMLKLNATAHSKWLTFPETRPEKPRKPLSEKEIAQIVTREVDAHLVHPVHTASFVRGNPLYPLHKQNRRQGRANRPLLPPQLSDPRFSNITGARIDLGWIGANLGLGWGSIRPLGFLSPPSPNPFAPFLDYPKTWNGTAEVQPDETHTSLLRHPFQWMHQRWEGFKYTAIYRFIFLTLLYLYRHVCVMCSIIASSMVNLNVSAFGIILAMVGIFVFCPSTLPPHRRILLAISHGLAHIVAALSILISIELVAEVCIRARIFAANGVHALYYNYRRQEELLFPDPNGFRRFLSDVTFGFYPAVIKWLMMMFDAPELYAVSRTVICRTAGITVVLSRLASAASFLAFFVYYWLLSTPIVAFILGCYLCVGLAFYNVHWDEGFSSLRIPHFKSFLRCRIDSSGDLHVFCIGLDRTPHRWKQDPFWRMTEAEIQSYMDGNGAPPPGARGDTPHMPYMEARPSRWIPKDPSFEYQPQVVDYFCIRLKDSGPQLEAILKAATASAAALHASNSQAPTDAPKYF